MSSKTDQINALHKVAEIMKQKDFAKLAELNKNKNALVKEIERLDQALAHGLNENYASAFSPLSLLSCQTDWQRWRRLKKHTLLADLAKLEAERELIKAKAKMSFGRSEAVLAMKEKLGSKLKAN
ncbi:MAG TPA: hypothetical protein ENK61_02935 [Devosia sp.]|nr:hypothetical protein [Devosia sp.]